MINKKGILFNQIKTEYEEYHSGWKDVIMGLLAIGIIVGLSKLFFMVVDKI